MEGKKEYVGLCEEVIVIVFFGIDSLQIYDCSDSVRVKKSKHKVQHKAPLNCMA